MAQLGLKKIFRGPTTYTNTASDVEGVGTLRFEGNQLWKWVKFTGTTAVTAGDPIYYVVTDLTLSTVDDAISVLPAGIAPVSIAAGTPTWGWIQLEGTATLSNTPSGTLAAGVTLTKGSTAGTLAAQTAATQPSIGTSVDGAKTIQCDFTW